MRKQPPKLEWHFIESDAEWASQQALLPLSITPAMRRRLQVKRYLWTVAMILLVLAGAGEWWRRTTAANLQAAEAALPTVVQPPPVMVSMPDREALVTMIRNERKNADGWRQHGWEDSALRAPTQTDEPTGDASVVLHRFAFQGDQAMVSLTLANPNGETMYRQARFYRRTPAGWLPAPPDAHLWQPDRSLATSYFLFHFGEQDRAVVLAVAPQMDALYITLLRNVGLPIDPSPQKLVVNVIVTQAPGQITVFNAANQVSIASPARYVAPVDLTDAELLAQALALPLIDHVVAQARIYHRIGSSWQPLVDGLSLWQLWDVDLPLAAWREEVVKWLYVDFPTSKDGQTVVLPPRYTELCASHKLWLWSPLQMHIPLICTEWQWENAHLRPWSHSDPPIRLAPPAVSTSDDWAAGLRSSPSHPSQAVAWATLTDYAVDTYGRERLPALLAGLGQYQSWATLLPAVYGVSSAEFEAGWQQYLAAHYGVPVRLPANPSMVNDKLRQAD